MSTQYSTTTIVTTTIATTTTLITTETVSDPLKVHDADWELFVTQEGKDLSRLFPIYTKPIFEVPGPENNNEL